MKNAIVGAVAMTIFLTACGSKTDANEKNFGVAVAQYLDKKGELCLDFDKWPVDVSQDDLRIKDGFPTGRANNMAALEAVGLVKSEDTALPVAGYDGKPTGATYKVKRYILTDAAKPYERKKEVEEFSLGGKIKEIRTNLCWGKMVLDKVVKWDGPMKLGDYQEASVKYQYKIEGVADWAKKRELLAAFPYVGEMTENAGKQEQHRAVKLTSVGWEALGLDN